MINMAALYEFWRLRVLRVRQVLSALVNGAQQHHVAFIPIGAAMYSAPTSLPQFVDFPNYTFGGSNPSHIDLNVDRKGLTTFSSNDNQWLVTDTTGVTDTLFYSAGTVHSALQTFGTDITSSTRVLLEGLAEFRAPLDPSLSLYRMREIPVLLEPSKEDVKEVKEKPPNRYKSSEFGRF
jgi:hypothetical protein